MELKMLDQKRGRFMDNKSELNANKLKDEKYKTQSVVI